MGELSLPLGSNVYIDIPVLIYTLENHPDFYSLLKPLWTKFENDRVLIATSELIITEALVLPLRSGNMVSIVDILMEMIDRLPMYVELLFD